MSVKIEVRLFIVPLRVWRKLAVDLERICRAAMTGTVTAVTQSKKGTLLKF